MASNSVFFAICFCISAGHANTDFINLKCNTKNVGQFGQQSILMCAIHTTQEVSNPEIRVVTWRKDGAKDPLLVFHDGKTTLKSGYKFAEPSWNSKNMNVSLLITNTEVSDDGLYTCSVITDSGDDNVKTNLRVTAKYNPPTVKSIPEKIVPDNDAALICKTDGGYPKGEVRWFDATKTDWTKSSKLEATQSKDGLFHLSSKLTLKSGSIFKYTCVVLNASGEKVHEVHFDPELSNKLINVPDDSGTKTSLTKVVAPVVVIGSLIVGLLIVMLFFRWRSRRDHRPVYTNDEEKGDFVDSNEDHI